MRSIGSADERDDAPELGDKPQTATKRYQCLECESNFSTSGHLTRHMRIHSGLKKFQCEVPGCERVFHRLDNCRQHEVAHKRRLIKHRMKEIAASSKSNASAQVLPAGLAAQSRGGSGSTSSGHTEPIYTDHKMRYTHFEGNTQGNTPPETPGLEFVHRSPWLPNQPISNEQQLRLQDQPTRVQEQPQNLQPARKTSKTSVSFLVD
ncbi:hypothetical protein BDR26DRAFT_851185 [Obelidium mucronatum]|nr:hypothetical protein BDR26DRAFT_851185 [Obelidium mucronatum]